MVVVTKFLRFVPPSYCFLLQDVTACIPVYNFGELQLYGTKVLKDRA